MRTVKVKHACANAYSETPRRLMYVTQTKVAYRLGDQLGPK